MNNTSTIDVFEQLLANEFPYSCLLNESPTHRPDLRVRQSASQK
jgi:hypothetical protein